MKGLFLTNPFSHEWFDVLGRHWRMSEAQQMMSRAMLDVFSCEAPDMKEAQSNYKSTLTEEAQGKRLNYFVYWATLVARRVLRFEINAASSMTLGSVATSLGFGAQEEAKPSADIQPSLVVEENGMVDPPSLEPLATE